MRDCVVSLRALRLVHTTYPGSDLHNYRQTEEGTGFVLGHEVVGEIVEVGSQVKKFQVGDIVAAPFASCCGESAILQRTGNRVHR